MLLRTPSTPVPAAASLSLPDLLQKIPRRLKLFVAVRGGKKRLLVSRGADKKMGVVTRRMSGAIADPKEVDRQRVKQGEKEVGRINRTVSCAASLN